jgi:hypothetical protein
VSSRGMSRLLVATFRPGQLALLLPLDRESIEQAREHDIGRLPPRIASTIAGASSVSRGTRPTYDALIFSAVPYGLANRYGYAQEGRRN